MNVFYGVCEQHTNKLIDAFFLREEEITKTLSMFRKYYAGSKYIDHYRHLIFKRLD